MCGVGRVIHDVGVDMGWWGPLLSDLAPSDISNGTPTEPVTHFNKLPEEYGKDPVSPVIDPFSNYLGFYMQTYNNVLGADEDVAPGVPQAAASLSQAITSATNEFKARLQKLHSAPDSPKGALANAALQNVNKSFYIPEAISNGASALGVLAQAFSNTIATTKNDIVSNFGNYNIAILNYPEQRDHIEQQYSNFAFAVTTQAYQPNILNIAENNPGFNAGPPPTVGGAKVPQAGAGGSAPTSGSTGAGGAGGGGAGGVVSGGAGGSSVAVPSGSNPGGPAGPETSTPAPQQSTTTPTSTPTDPSTGTYSPAAAAASTPAAAGYSGSGLSNIGSSLQGLASPLQSALGQAMNAGKGGAGAPPGANSLGKPPPEGKLALGGKGSGGGGAGGGAGAHGPALAKPASAPGTTAERTVAAGSRAGLSAAPGSAGAGAPGAGAPAAGQQGGAAAGANHQPSKALRRKRNGENLIGNADAVVPVLGEPAPAEDAKPEAAPARGLR